MTTSIHDLQPQLTANRRFWTGWDAAADADAALPVYRTDIPHPLLNGVLRVDDVPLDAAIEEATAALGGTSWSWWVGADSDDGTAEGLLARGARQTSDMPIMAIDVTTAAGLRTPDEVRVVQVSEPTAVDAFVRCYAEPLGFPASSVGKMVECELAHDALGTGSVRLAALIDDRMVGTAVLSLATGVAAVYFVATDAAYRGLGVATTLSLEALRLTRESGRRIVTLQASTAGERVYRRIGFETVARYRLFEAR